MFAEERQLTDHREPRVENSVQMVKILPKIPFLVNSVLSAFLFGVWIIYTALIIVLTGLISLRINYKGFLLSFESSLFALLAIILTLF